MKLLLVDFMPTEVESFALTPQEDRQARRATMQQFGIKIPIKSFNIPETYEPYVGG